MNEKEREALLARATKLESDAIRVAESEWNHHDWPRSTHSRVALAELRLKAAAILRDRAETSAA